MASVDFKKMKNVTEVKRKFRHCDRDLRKLDSHSNLEIDKTKTHMNTQTYAYMEICQKFDGHLAMLDAKPGANKRKDRVICFGLEVPVPKDLPKDQYTQWFKDVDGIMQEFDGYLGSFIHYDEVHKYRDAETSEMRESRVHGHYFCIPEIDGRLNGKVFSNKTHMRALNNQIQQMSLEKYNVEFMDGTKKKSRKTVEQLKNESSYKEAEAELALQKLSLKVVRNVINMEKYELEKKEESVSQREAELVKKEDAVSKVEKELEKRKENMSQHEVELTKKEYELTDREASLDKRETEDNVYGYYLRNKDKMVSQLQKELYSDKMAFQTVLNTISGKEDGSITDAEMALRVRLHREMQEMDESIRKEFEELYKKLRTKSYVPWKRDMITKKVTEWKSGDEAMRLWEQAQRERMMMRYGPDSQEQENATGQKETRRTFQIDMPVTASDDSYSL